MNTTQASSADLIKREPAMQAVLRYFKYGIYLIPGLLLLGGLYLTSLYDYLLFHSIAETFSLVVTVGIFIFAWNARRYLENNYLLFVGIVYLFVAVLDVLHTLAYQGMGVFEGFGANLPTQLWVAGRLMESTALLIAPFFLNRRLRVWLVFGFYTLLTAFVLACIFYWQVFPVSYIDGVGLTPFKVASEFVVIAFLIAAMVLLLQKRQEFAPAVLRLLVASLIAFIFAESFFSDYVSVYGAANLAGHFFRIVAFYLMYKAVIETGLVKPYDILLRRLNQNQESLLKYTRELQTRNEELNAFAHTVAHDLKNPMASLIISSKVVQEPGLTDRERSEFLQDIADTARKMNQIIENLLLLSEVRMKDVPADPIDMAAVVENAIDRLAAEFRKHRAQINLEEDWPVSMGYAPWVEEIWVNYLSNALKYGGDPPCLELGAARQPDGMVRFWVRDYGPGVSPKDQALLFKPFTQLRRIDNNGHGLGLSIVQRIAVKLGGQVGVESEPGKGSLFYFTLPTSL
jgi:signal transduction histidine kinase